MKLFNGFFGEYLKLQSPHSAIVLCSFPFAVIFDPFVMSPGVLIDRWAGLIEGFNLNYVLPTVNCFYIVIRVVPVCATIRHYISYTDALGAPSGNLLRALTPYHELAFI